MHERTHNEGPNWHVNDQVLWVVWSRQFEPFLKVGMAKDPIRVGWVLASPGAVGWAEIAGPRGYPHRLVAAMPLRDLRTQTSVPEPVARLMRQPYIAFAWMPRTPRVARLATWLRSAYGSPLPLCVRGRKSLHALVVAGEAIVAKRDYRAVDGDLRPEAPGHDAYWLWSQRDAEATRRLKAFLAEAQR